MRHVSHAFPIALATVLALTATAAFAEAAPNDAPAAAADQDATAQSSGGIMDIVVTAQRRRERTQDVPAAISAFGSEQLARQNVTGVETLARRTPGFYLGSGGPLRPALFIRGVGSRAADAGSEVPVGVFLDDVYLGRTSSALGTLKDIERVEILRGPQGTLYGRNTIGGAVNIISKAPTDEFEGRLDLGASTYKGWNMLLAAGGPVTGSGNVRARFAVWRDKRDGYLTNLTDGHKILGVDNLGGRLRVDFDLSNDITFSGIADYSHDGDGAGFVGIRKGNAVNPNAAFLVPSTTIPKSSGQRYADYLNSNPTLDRKVYGFTGKLVADLHGAELTSISAYRGVEAHDTRDLDASSVLAAEQFSDERSKQFTQEVRLASTDGGMLTLDGHLTWLVGAYYYHDSSHRSDRFDLYSGSVLGALPGIKRSQASADYTTSSYALFSQITLNPVEGFDVTLGARYSHDKKTALPSGTNTIPGTPIVSVYTIPMLERSWSSFDPKVVLAYHFNKDINVYASYSRGFKSGGFQYVPLSAAQAALAYDPEHLEAWEVGFKSIILDNTIRFNAAAYQYDYSDMQVTQNVLQPNNTVAVLVTNAATSKIRGVDVEFVWKPIRQIELGATYNYLNAKFKHYTFAPPGIPVTTATNFSDTALTRSPKNSFSVYGELTLPIGSNDGDVILRADYAYRSKFFFEPGHGNIIYGPTVPLTVQEGYGLLDLRATYRAGPFSISAFAENVTNAYYLRSTISFGATITHFPGQPRVVGAQLGYRF